MVARLIIFALFWSTFSFANSSIPNVLFLHSYDEQNGWDQGIKRGFNEMLNAHTTVNVYHEYMDAKRFPHVAENEDFYLYLTKKYENRKLTAMVIADDPAMSLYLDHSSSQFLSIPIFFMGVGYPDPRIFALNHVKGVLENRNLAQAIIDIKSTLSQDELIVLSDSTSTGIAYRKELLDAKQSPNAPQTLHFLTDMTAKELTVALREFPDTTPILVAGQLRDPITDELLPWEQAYIELGMKPHKKPYFALLPSALRHGAFAVFTLDPIDHGGQATQLLIDYLNGTKIEHIQSILKSRNSWVWHFDQLKRRNLSLKELPQGSSIIGKEKPKYEFNLREILVYLVIMASFFIIIVLLLVMIRNGKRSEAALTEKVSLTEKLEYEASHDYLTGLVNRRTFNARLKRYEKKRFLSFPNRNIYIAFLDLDNFKTINDTAGHMVGDSLLSELSKLMSQHLSEIDVFARLGGDEFGLILPDRTLQEIELLCTDMISTVKDYRLVWNDASYGVGISIGVIRCDEGDCQEVLMSLADIACYKAKDMGKNCTYFSNSRDRGMQTEQVQMGYIADITGALENEQFFLAKQRILPLSPTNNAPHYEILLRYNDKDGNPVPPGLFIPVAEKHGLITLIDKWVVQTILSQYTELFADENPIVSINLSGVSLSNASFLSDVLEMVANSDVDMGKVCFEVTETAVVSHINRAITFIEELKKTGCKFALDDFGSGSSSYGYLKTLPVDYLKIDGSLIKSIIDEPIDQTIVNSINEIAHEMGMETIAEFVENDEILSILRDIGIDYGQGYGIHKPQTCIKSTPHI
ncbi:EAL domain-containing protein [Vibrio sp. WJH972]